MKEEINNKINISINIICNFGDGVKSKVFEKTKYTKNLFSKKTYDIFLYEVMNMLTFNHFNFNVADLDKALQFYKDALDLEPVRRKEAADGSYVLVFLGDGKTDFQLELTWLRDHPQKYNLGECEFHLALRADDYEAAHARHEAMGCICFENPKMGIYFIQDPDGYCLPRYCR